MSLSSKWIHSETFLGTFLGNKFLIEINTCNCFRRQQQEQSGPSFNMKIRVTLEELYIVKDVEVTYNRKIICPHCRGSGADNPEDVHTCPSCNGQGFTIQK